MREGTYGVSVFVRFYDCGWKSILKGFFGEVFHPLVPDLYVSGVAAMWRFWSRMVWFFVPRLGRGRATSSCGFCLNWASSNSHWSIFRDNVHSK